MIVAEGTRLPRTRVTGKSRRRGIAARRSTPWICMCATGRFGRMVARGRIPGSGRGRCCSGLLVVCFVSLMLPVWFAIKRGWLTEHADGASSRGIAGVAALGEAALVGQAVSEMVAWPAADTAGPLALEGAVVHGAGQEETAVPVEMAGPVAATDVACYGVGVAALLLRVARSGAAAGYGAPVCQEDGISRTVCGICWCRSGCKLTGGAEPLHVLAPFGGKLPQLSASRLAAF
jgi:hypothetical protein